MLLWSEAHLSGLIGYKVWRAPQESFSGASLIFSGAGTNFYDETLESETAYYYKIAACDASDRCIFSNIASTTSLVFPFSWSSPLRLSDTATTSYSFYPDIAIGQDGRPAAVWYSQMLGEVRRIYFSIELAIGSWLDSAEQYISRSFMAHPYWPRIFSRGSDFDVLYSGEIPPEGAPQERDALLIRKDGELWPEPQNVSESGISNVAPSGLRDETGTLYIVWQGKSTSTPYTNIQYRAVNVDGSYAGAVEEIPGSLKGRWPNIVLGDDNKLYAAWYHCNLPGACDSLYYSVNALDGSPWSEAAKLISFDSLLSFMAPPAMLSLPNGKVLLAWSASSYEIHLTDFDGAATSTRQTVSTSRPDAIGPPSLFSSGSGKPYLLFDGYGGGQYNVFFTSRRQDLSWRSPKSAYGSISLINNPRAAVDADNLAHIIYSGGPANSHIYYVSGPIE